MKNILLFGAGKSTTVLIDYLLKQSSIYQWQLTVVDANPMLAQSKIGNHPNGFAVSFDIVQDAALRSQSVSKADIVISMLLPDLHHIIALDCIQHKKHLLTASYIDERIKLLEPEIKSNSLLFLCEMGLDPGIDHMSAMQMIDKITAMRGNITSFKSHCGGLVAPEYDNNPWHYKITWNPANVVNAGKSGAIYKQSDQIIEQPYSGIFKNCDTVHIPAIGDLAAYPNRNSITYTKLYNLEYIATFIRSTLRHPDFCIGWQHIINMGLTNDQLNIEPFLEQPVSVWFHFCLTTYTNFKNWNEYLSKAVAPEHQPLIKRMFEYLGLLNNESIPSAAKTSSSILQHFLEKKLKLLLQEKDMIIMQHSIEYQTEGRIANTMTNTLIVKGDNALYSAMAKTVGLPLAIATELILTKSISLSGLHIPILKEIYEPVLKKLKENKICFSEI